MSNFPRIQARTQRHTRRQLTAMHKSDCVNRQHVRRRRRHCSSPYIKVDVEIILRGKKEEYPGHSYRMQHIESDAKSTWLIPPGVQFRRRRLRRTGLSGEEALSWRHAFNMTRTLRTRTGFNGSAQLDQLFNITFFTHTGGREKVEGCMAADYPRWCVGSIYLPFSISLALMTLVSQEYKTLEYTLKHTRICILFH